MSIIVAFFLLLLILSLSFESKYLIGSVQADTAIGTASGLANANVDVTGMSNIEKASRLVSIMQKAVNTKGEEDEH